MGHAGLQIKIASEETKFGFDFNHLTENLNPSEFKNVRFRGVMGMATFTDDKDQVRNEFAKLRKYGDFVFTKYRCW